MDFELKLKDVKQKCKNNNNKVLPFVFCCNEWELSYLGLNKIGYVRTSMGWNFDVLNLDNYIIICGVRNLFGYRIKGDFLQNLYEKIPNNLERHEIIKDLLLQYFRICFDVNLFETEFEKLQYLEKIKTSEEFLKLQNNCKLYGFTISLNDFVLKRY